MYLYLNASIFTYFEDGISNPNPTDMTGLVEGAIAAYCTGFIVETGGLLATDGTGSIPVEYNGSIVTASAVVVDADLFTAGNQPGGGGGGEGEGGGSSLPTGSVELLQHFDGDFTDDSGNSRSFSNDGGASTSSAQAKFGSESLLVTEPGSISTTADSGFDLGTEDFTIELFTYPTATITASNTFETIIAASGQGNWYEDRAWQLRTERNTNLSRLIFEFMVEGSSDTYTFSADSATILANAWNHIVVQRDYSQQKIVIWLNGTAVYTSQGGLVASAIRQVSDKSGAILRIGAKADTGTASFPGFQGHIDDVRIVKSGLRYDMDASSITVPTSPLTTDPPA